MFSPCCPRRNTACLVGIALWVVEGFVVAGTDFRHELLYFLMTMKEDSQGTGHNHLTGRNSASRRKTSRKHNPVGVGSPPGDLVEKMWETQSEHPIHEKLAKTADTVRRGNRPINSQIGWHQTPEFTSQLGDSVPQVAYPRPIPTSWAEEDGERTLLSLVPKHTAGGVAASGLTQMHPFMKLIPASFPRW